MSSIILFVILFFFSSMIISKKETDFNKRKNLVLKSLIISMFLSIAITEAIDYQTSMYVNPLESDSHVEYDYGKIEIEEDESSINNTVDSKTSEEIKEDGVKDPDKINVVEDETSEVVEKEGKVHFIDVGQGDSILLQSPSDEFVLVDGGTKKDGEKVINYLKKLNVEKLDMIIATHPHEDHIGGLIQVINQFEVDKVVMPNKSHTTKTFENLLKTIDSKDLKITIPEINSNIGFSSMPITVLHPDPEGKHSNLNDYSVSVLVEINNNKVLLSGDAEVEAESLMTKRFQDNLKADVMKAGHHGSTTSNTDSFLDFVDPDYVIISSGKNNKYGHPHKEILSKLKDRNIEVYNTAENGDVIVTIKDDISITTTK